MDIKWLRALVEETNLSPERLGDYFHVSGMTIRRWLKQNDAFPISNGYQAILQSGIDKLLLEGKLNGSSTLVIKDNQEGENSFLARLKNLGFPDFSTLKGQSASDNVFLGLQEIGSSDNVHAEVLKKAPRIKSFKALGKEWTNAIGTPLKIIRSKKLTRTDKFIAFGALFYLLSPLDLIPDNIPIIGYLDDLAILQMATGYYVNKFGKQFS